MPLIESGIAHCNHQCDQRPPQIPAPPGATHAVEHSNTEGAKLGDMSQFANSDVYPAKFTISGKGEEPVEEGDDDPRGFLSTEIVGGEGGNEDGHADRWNPVLEACRHRESVAAVSGHAQRNLPFRRSSPR